MNAEKPSARALRYVKRQKRNDEKDSITASDTPNPRVEQIGDIFKLDIDCYEEVFDYLPIEDLVNVGKTCKRLQQVAGHCFQQCYSGKGYIGSSGITNDCNGIDIKHFVPFIRQVCIEDERGFQDFIDSHSKFSRLKQMEIHSATLTCVNRLNEISLNGIEDLRVWNSDLGHSFHEIINKYVKLRRLEIMLYCEGEWNWFRYSRCPTLEYLKISIDSVEDITTFLELNPNIRKFATKLNVMYKNRDAMISTRNVKLDDLAILLHTPDDEKLVPDEDATYELLYELYKRGFYKRLHLYVWEAINQEQIIRLSGVNGLVKLFINRLTEPLALSPLKNIEEIFVRDSKYLYDLDTMTMDLVNLRRIHFFEASLNDITPFFKRSVEMEMIKVDRFVGGIHFDKNAKVINLLALNRERERLMGATKITLFVEEDIYLATKRAMKGNDFTSIRLKRDTSYEWEHFF